MRDGGGRRLGADIVSELVDAEVHSVNQPSNRVPKWSLQTLVDTAVAIPSFIREILSHWSWRHAHILSNDGPFVLGGCPFERQEHIRYACSEHIFSLLRKNSTPG